MRGTKILIIDPESEYKELCKNLHGDWINCGGGSKGRINPLQIRPVPTDDEDEAGELLSSDDGNGMGDMALHMKTLEIFFNLYKPSLTDMHTATLKLCLIEIYNKFGIFWDTDISSLKNENFPIFTNLFEVIEVRRDKEENQDIKKIYIDLSFLLYDIVNGSDQFLWNGHTTISTQTRCVCLDTHDLQNTSDSIKRTQYFTVLYSSSVVLGADVER